MLVTNLADLNRRRDVIMINSPFYDAKIIGNNLKKCRLFYGYSVESIRDYLGLESVQSIYQYEKGVTLPRAEAMLALMELYGVSPAELRDAGFEQPQR